MPRPTPGPDPAALKRAGYDPATLAAIAASPAARKLDGGPPLPGLLLLLAAAGGAGCSARGAARQVCGDADKRHTVEKWLAWLEHSGLAAKDGDRWQLTGPGTELHAAAGEAARAHRDQVAAATRAAADRAAEQAAPGKDYHSLPILEDQAATADLQWAAERAEWEAGQGGRDRQAAAEQARLEAARRDQAARRHAEQAERWREQARRRRRARRAARWAAVRQETSRAGGLTWALALTVAALAGLWLWAGRHSPAAAGLGAVLAAAVVLAAAWAGRTVAAGVRLGWRRVRGTRPAPAPEPGRWEPGPGARWRRARDDVAARR